jgi:hypothetical protein
MHSLNRREYSVESQRALQDLDALGYDIPALLRMDLNDERIVDLRDKAFQYRNIKLTNSVAVKHIDPENQITVSRIADKTGDSSNVSKYQKMGSVEQIIYLAEKDLSCS